MMTYEEAEALKNSLKSGTYISKSGHELKIFIAPETKLYLDNYKGAVKYYLENGKMADKVSRAYARDGKFTLFGIRRVKYDEYSGGLLDLNEHPELI